MVYHFHSQNFLEQQSLGQNTTIRKSNQWRISDLARLILHKGSKIPLGLTSTISSNLVQWFFFVFSAFCFSVLSDPIFREFFSLISLSCSTIYLQVGLIPAIKMVPLGQLFISLVSCNEMKSPVIFWCFFFLFLFLFPIGYCLSCHQ